MTIGGKAVLLDQLGACHDDPSWIAPLAPALARLTAAQAAHRDTDATHSVWQIVNHLAYWNERWLNRFLGRPISAETLANDATFGGAGDPADDAAWRAAVARVTAVLAAWRKAVAACDESRLSESIPNYPADAQWWGIIANQAMHNAYHIGQIVHIRKQQGTWTTQIK